MSKSSLSKIVRNFIEQAKDGSANNYAPPRAPLATTTLPSQAKPTSFHGNPGMKKPATISKEVPKPKRPTGVGDTRNLVRTGKPQVAPTEQITTATVPLEPKSKNISLNNSKLNPSPSRSRTVAGNTAAKEDLTGMSYDRILMGSVGHQDDSNTQTGMAIGVMSP